MDKLDYVRKRVIKHTWLWPHICEAKIVSERTLFKIKGDGYMPSYKTVNALYDYFKGIGK